MLHEYTRSFDAFPFVEETIRGMCLTDGAKPVREEAQRSSASGGAVCQCDRRRSVRVSVEAQCASDGRAKRLWEDPSGGGKGQVTDPHAAERHRTNQSAISHQQPGHTAITVPTAFTRNTRLHAARKANGARRWKRGGRVIDGAWEAAAAIASSCVRSVEEQRGNESGEPGW